MSSAVCRDGDSFTRRVFPDFQKQCQPLVEPCDKPKGKKQGEGEDRGAGAADKLAFWETAKGYALVTQLEFYLITY